MIYKFSTSYNWNIISDGATIFIQPLNLWDVSKGGRHGGRIFLGNKFQPADPIVGCEQGDIHGGHVLVSIKFQPADQIMGCEQCDTQRGLVC